MNNSDPIAISTVVADVIISISYFAIPIEIWFFQRSLKRPLPFKYVLVFFELFIAACGFTHLVGVWSPWTRTDPALLAVKALCALISSATAIVLITIIPKIFSFPARAARIEEELGFRIRHEHTLQRTNTLLIKFRKITNNIRQTLDCPTICESAVTELCTSLNFSGMALFLPNEDDGGYFCQAEFIKTVQPKLDLAPMYQTHYWKTVTMDCAHPTFRKIVDVTSICYLNGSDLVSLANKQRGMVYQSGLAKGFQYGQSGQRAFILAFNEVESSTLNEEDCELFEDVVSQIEIALQQARQIQVEHLHLEALRRQLNDNANLDRAKHSAEFASKVKTHLLSSLGHEINEPINDISGLIQALRQSPLTGSQVELVDRVQTRSKTLDAIMNDLNDFINIDDHGLTLESLPLQITSVVQQTLTHLNPTLISKGWRTSLELAPSVPLWIMGDHKRIHQIINNIITNLISSAATPGLIRIAITLDSEPPQDIPFLRDPKCFKFHHHLNPSKPDSVYSSQPSSTTISPSSPHPTKTSLYFHIIGLESPSDPLTDPTDWVRSVGISSLRPGLGLTVVAHLIQLYGGNLMMRHCSHRGSVYSFAILVPREDSL